MNRLSFVPPTQDALIATLEGWWAQQPDATIAIVGNAPLAQSLVKHAAQRGKPVQPLNRLSPEESASAQYVLFTETDGEKLAAALMDCVDRPELTVVAPETNWYFSQRPLFLVTIPKSGTHLAYELAEALGYEGAVELPEFPEGGKWYCLEYSNSHTVARDFFVDSVRRAPFGNRHHAFMRSPALFIYRHPLDILVSEAHYYHRDGKTSFAGWLPDDSFEARLDKLLNDPWLLGPLRERLGAFTPWLDFPNVISFSFEELIGAAGGADSDIQQRLIWSIQLKLHAPGNPREIAARLFNPESATFREGKIGGFVKQLPPEVIQHFLNDNQDLLTRFGYPADGTIALPTHNQTWRRRSPKYSSANFDKMPMTLQSGFLGCNLVRFDGRIYALPQNVGRLPLATLSSEQLAAIPSAPTIDELKALLMMGRHSYNQRTESLISLGKKLVDADAIYHAANDEWIITDTPRIIDSYHGFNLIEFRNFFIAIRQTLGEVDLYVDWSDLIDKFNHKDLIITGTISELKLEIDGLSITQRFNKLINIKSEEKENRISRLEKEFSKIYSKYTAGFSNILTNATKSQSALDHKVSHTQREIENTDLSIQMLFEDSISINNQRFLKFEQEQSQLWKKELDSIKIISNDQINTVAQIGAKILELNNELVRTRHISEATKISLENICNNELLDANNRILQNNKELSQLKIQIAEVHESAMKIIDVNFDKAHEQIQYCRHELMKIKQKDQENCQAMFEANQTNQVIFLQQISQLRTELLDILNHNQHEYITLHNSCEASQAKTLTMFGQFYDDINRNYEALEKFQKEQAILIESVKGEISEIINHYEKISSSSKKFFTNIEDAIKDIILKEKDLEIRTKNIEENWLVTFGKKINGFIGLIKWKK
ncbi:hypothetical protein [Chitinivorax sp. B]|uniref:hypothetical protein n=1 Tax=Chitinivorax sp. B TaxID=2502235 RepID=UPI0010F5E273|nr:hypothetical protein [Chitinivorax sp. B]